MIRITAKREGYRRAGIAHSRTPAEHSTAAFSAEQLDALRADPHLVVVDVPVEPAPVTGSTTGGDLRVAATNAQGNGEAAEGLATAGAADPSEEPTGGPVPAAPAEAAAPAAPASRRPRGKA